jgi:hypothetical protein
VQHKLIIGRKEVVSFPEYGLENVMAKVDTGAYTSSLHCTSIKEKNGKLEFTLVHPSGQKASKNHFATEHFRRKEIKSSNGTIQERYLIKTKITLLGKTYLSEFSLANRSKMKHPVLLGRKLLMGRFLVDVSKTRTKIKKKP